MKKSKIFVVIVTFILPLMYVVFRGLYYLGAFYAAQAQTAQGKEQAFFNDKAYKYFKLLESANGLALILAIIFLLLIGSFLLFRLISFKNYVFALLVFMAAPFVYLKCLDLAVVGMAKTSSYARPILVLRHPCFWVFIAVPLVLSAILKICRIKKA